MIATIVFYHQMAKDKKKKVKKTKNQAQTKTGKSVVASNKKASYDFHLDKEYIAGIVLQGTEVKSLRNCEAQIKGAFAKIIEGELWLFNCHIPEYKYGNRNNHDPNRAKKLLMKKNEILKIQQEIQLKRRALVVSKLFFKSNYAKVVLHLAEAKKNYDKRETIKKKDIQRELDRNL
jgi:SsrA-binding protein